MTDPGQMDPDDLLLTSNAQDGGDGLWWFTRPAVTYSRGDALRIIRTCAALNIPISDVIGWEVIAAIAGRLPAG